MKLNSKNDANQWASDLLAGTEYGDAEHKRLSEYLWTNFHGKTWEEIKPQLPQDQDFWELVEGRE